MGRPASKPIRSTRLRYHLIGRGPMYKVAAEAKIHPTTLSAYSLGYKPIPPLHLMALAEVLGVPEDDLIGDCPFDLEELQPL